MLIFTCPLTTAGNIYTDKTLLNRYSHTYRHSNQHNIFKKYKRQQKYTILAMDTLNQYECVCKRLA